MYVLPPQHTEHTFERRQLRAKKLVIYGQHDWSTLVSDYKVAMSNSIDSWYFGIRRINSDNCLSVLFYCRCEDVNYLIQ